MVLLLHFLLIPNVLRRGMERKKQGTLLLFSEYLETNTVFPSGKPLSATISLVSRWQTAHSFFRFLNFFLVSSALRGVGFPSTQRKTKISPPWSYTRNRMQTPNVKIFCDFSRICFHSLFSQYLNPPFFNRSPSHSPIFSYHLSTQPTYMFSYTYPSHLLMCLSDYSLHTHPIYYFIHPHLFNLYPTPCTAYNPNTYCPSHQLTYLPKTPGRNCVLNFTWA
jgi:hypothetical protein